MASESSQKTTATNTPELLSPAGTFRNMEYAFAYGADAVYAGQPRYSLRVRNNDFTLDNLGKGIARAHDAHQRGVADERRHGRPRFGCRRRGLALAG